MRNFFTSAVGLLAGLSAAAPLTTSLMPRTANLDITILQFALTLEHLENVFYKEALLKFSEADFQKAGFNKQYFEDLLFVIEDEQSHVQLLTAAITAAGQAPVAACTYNFPVTDVQSFVTLSSVLEGVGTSAYLGAAALVTDKTILTTAASIMVTEALHTSQQRAAVNVVPAANSLGTPLGANAVFTLAASFIVSCPATNVALPFKAFPALAVDASSCPGQKKSSKRFVTRSNETASAAPQPAGKGSKGSDSSGKGNNNNNDNISSTGAQVVCPQPHVLDTLNFVGASTIPSGSFLTFVSGLTTVSIQTVNIVDVTITSIIPVGLGGQTYVFVTNKAVTGSIADQDILMGPAIIEVIPTPPVIDLNVLRRSDEKVESRVFGLSA